MPLPVLLILYVAVVCAFCALLWSGDRLLTKRRTTAMSAWANAHGYAFEGVVPAPVDGLSEFELFGRGHAREARDLMRRSSESGAVRVCEYGYSKGLGRMRQPHKVTLCVLTSKGIAAPHIFLLRRLLRWYEIGRDFGGRDVELRGAPGLAKAYTLKLRGDDGRLQSFLSPRLREVLTGMAHKRVFLELVGDTLILHRGRILKPEQIEELVSDAEAIHLAAR